MRPCSIEVEARLGKPMTSPAAVDVRHGGLEGLRVDLRGGRGRRPRGRQRRGSSAVGRADAAGGEQHHLGANAAAVLQDGDRPVVSSISMPLDLGAEAQRDAAVAQLVDEFVDHLAVDEVEDAWRGSISVTCTSSAEKIVAYSTPMTPAPITVRLRGRRGELEDLVAVEDAGAVERNVVGPVRPGADGDQNALAAATCGCRRASAATSMRCGSRKRAAPPTVCTPLRANWCSSTSTSWSSVMCRRATRSLRGDVLLDPVGAAVEAALAPAGEVEHGLAQRLRRDGAGVHRDAADAAALLDHQHGLAELGRLDGGAPAGRAAADDDEIEGAHGREGAGGSGGVSIAIVLWELTAPLPRYAWRCAPHRHRRREGFPTYDCGGGSCRGSRALETG